MKIEEFNSGIWEQGYKYSCITFRKRKVIQDWNAAWYARGY